MSILWQRGSGTVAEIRKALGPSVGYTGVLKMLQILESKDMVRHEREGRAYRYFPLVQPDDAGARAIAKIVDKVFHGSAELAIGQLISGRIFDANEVTRMKALIDAASQEDR